MNEMRGVPVREILQFIDVAPEITDPLVLELANRVNKMLLLHRKLHHLHDNVDICGQCTDDWPCRTVEILDGR